MLIDTNRFEIWSGTIITNVKCLGALIKSRAVNDPLIKKEMFPLPLRGIKEITSRLCFCDQLTSG